MASNIFKTLVDAVLKHGNGVQSGHSSTAPSRGPLIKPPKKVIKEDVMTDEDIVGAQSPLRKIQYEISKAKGKQVR